MNTKIYISANELLLDSFRLARKILDSGWGPDVLVALWRGGTPVGVAVHEFLAYHGVATSHMALKCASYSGIGKRSDVRVEFAEPVLASIRVGQRVLVVDDIFDSGCTADTLLRRLADTKADVRIATAYWKPSKNATALTPHYYVRTTEAWVVFPHELVGLTLEEVACKSADIRALITAPAHGVAAATDVRPSTQTPGSSDAHRPQTPSPRLPPPMTSRQ